MHSDLTQQDFMLLDKNDPLANFRDQFHIPKDTVYMDGNSLGVMPIATKQRINDVLQREWSEDLIRSWNDNHWFDSPFRIGDKIAQIIGADSGEVVATDSVSINIFKLLVAALNYQKDTGRVQIVSEKGNFPTDLYMMAGLKSMLSNIDIVTVEREQISDAITTDTAVLLLTDVHYKTGHLLDKKHLTELAHSKGALVIWDLCHSAGALPVDLNVLQADMAVGCGYKYLNGGPGAPAYLFVASRLQEKLKQPLSGWWGHENPFAFSDDYQAGAGIKRMLCGTQSILALSALEVGVDIFLAADMSLIRTKSLRMSGLFMQLLTQRCSKFGFTLLSPESEAQRGSQVAFTHEHAYPIMQALIEHKIIGDFRAPDVLRFGLTPLYLRYTDIWQAVLVLETVMRTESWRHDRYKVRSTVT